MQSSAARYVPSDLAKVQALDGATGEPIAVQYVPPPPNAEGPSRALGTLILRLPQPGVTAVRLAFDQPESGTAAFDPTAKLSTAQVTHDAAHQAGLPHSILFRSTDTKFQDFNWNDRLYHQELGGFLLRHDKQAKLSIISDGPICRVYRVEASYKRADGTAPETNPRAVYDWHYFHDQPIVFVTATISQDEAFAWNEAHFLELNFPGDDFTRWAGGSPWQTGDLLGNSSSHRLSDWAAVMSEHDAIAMFGCGRVLVHDGRGQYGTYLHAAGDRSWENWQDTHHKFSGWLWLGDAAQISDAIEFWRQQMPRMTQGSLTDSQTHEAIANARHEASQLPQGEHPVYAWRAAMARRLEAEGRPEQAMKTLGGQVPDSLTAIWAADIWFTVRDRADGIETVSLLDAARQHEHLTRKQPPLFEIILRNTDTGTDVTLFADRGWQATSASKSGWGPGYLTWSKPANELIGDLTVEAQAWPDQHNTLRWRFTVSKPEPPWSVWQVRFPQLELAPPGKQSALFFPRGPGEVTTTAWSSAFSFGGTYPSGWLSMQFLASYDPESRHGLYWGLHDPLGSTKDISAKSRHPQGTVLLSVTHPAPGRGQPGNGFELSGEAVWQMLRGDWYDAARIYRAWAQEHAQWYPQLGPEGREDTPLWMRELCAWAQAGGTADQCVEQVQRFAEFLDVPVGYHWYNWHKIPFDNDYPHYFPATDGFVEGAGKLQAANVFVMPYINGRLWDTRDRGGEDYLFTEQALPAVTKDEQGTPFTETYGSKEEDDSSVRLGVMCPATTTWQNKMREINRRLFTECGVDGVYIDQIAAASPKTCMDTSHGHPTGGGHWWNEGYWKMLELIRQDMRPDQMLTTECNAEPFLRWFDGYLTWHWQYDGQVPAFPAVYGGAIQMFGAPIVEATRRTSRCG